MAPSRPFPAPEGFLALPFYIMDANRTSSVLEEQPWPVIKGSSLQTQKEKETPKISFPRTSFLLGVKVCNKVHKRPQNLKLPSAAELAIPYITCKIAAFQHGPWCWEAKTALQLPFHLQEMPGWMLWQEKLSSRLGLAPKETIVWAVPDFLPHTKS